MLPQSLYRDLRLFGHQPWHTSLSSAPFLAIRIQSVPQRAESIAHPTREWNSVSHLQRNYFPEGEVFADAVLTRNGSPLCTYLFGEAARSTQVRIPDFLPTGHYLIATALQKYGARSLLGLLTKGRDSTS